MKSISLQKNDTLLSQPVLIYDSRCPICTGTVKWIEKNERNNSFRMMPCQSETRAFEFPVLAQEDCLKAMHLVLPNGTVLVGEKAVPEILKRLKRYWLLEALFKIPGMGTLSGVFYRWFAKYRYQIANFFTIHQNKK